MTTSSSIPTASCSPSAPPFVSIPLSRRLLIIDTDVGCDDAIALLLALRDSSVTVLAITTVYGNVGHSQATHNAHLLLSVLDADPHHQIPVFEGAAASLLKFENDIEGWPGHGANGLGDSDFGELNKAKVKRRKQVDLKRKDQWSAAEAINELVKEYPGQIDLVALGVTKTPQTTHANRQTKWNKWRQRISTQDALSQNQRDGHFKLQRFI